MVISSGVVECLPGPLPWSQQNRPLQGDIMSDIPKPWCAFGGMLPDSVGKIVRDSGNSVEILYTEGQYYPPQLWDPMYVRRFETSEEAIAASCVYSDDSFKRAMDIFIVNFPSVVVDLKKLKRHIKKLGLHPERKS